MIKKGLTIGTILLFIAIAISPSINFNIVKASNDNDLVEVTTQVFGIQGFGNTIVKLTREQYQNLKQYLVDFSKRLNQTTNREEAVPIFKEAVVKLNRYGLLPKGISVRQTQKLVLGELFPTKIFNLLKKIVLIQNKSFDIPDDVLNLFCYIYAHTLNAFEENIWVFTSSLFGHLYYKYDLKIFSFLYSVFYEFYEYGQLIPYRFMNVIVVPGPGIGGETYSYYTLGLLGIQKGSNDFDAAYGFSGVKLILEHGEAVYFGFALRAI